ncbi:hypothetical protein M758_8G004500 [Ceratodon purpureus]|uniref:Uncharacterized protein n=1 Tax=Ceratodon purpureus TaxID=3225 RepID=A0A8T0GYB1_CERPU|nr:hypothetical protein KC19_8G005000 [Ceratodon purpureus]KAG0607130.1 hypothetical protein M758_8G004500 [Ceratodon purpureus]
MSWELASTASKHGTPDANIARERMKNDALTHSLTRLSAVTSLGKWSRLNSLTHSLTHSLVEGEGEGEYNLCNVSKSPCCRVLLTLPSRLTPAVDPGVGP